MPRRIVLKSATLYQSVAVEVIMKEGLTIQISVKNSETEVGLELKGKVSIKERNLLLCKLLKDRYYTVSIDLGEVSTFDDSVIQVLRTMSSTMRKDGRQFSVFNAPEGFVDKSIMDMLSDIEEL